MNSVEAVRKSNRRILAFVLAALLCLSVLPGTARAAEDAKAATVRLASTTGTVTVKDAGGQSKTVRKDMRLYSGYTVATGAKSSALLSLDDTKSVKLDASAAVEVRKSGTKLEVVVSSGNIYFDVAKPLTANEALNIRTSTMVCGIRGSFGWANPEGMGLVHGTGELLCTDPMTGRTRFVRVSSGEGVFIDPTRAGGSNRALNEVGYSQVALTNEALPAGMVGIILSDPNKQQQVQEVQNLDLQTLSDMQEGKQAAEDAARADADAAAQKALGEQLGAGSGSIKAVNPVWSGQTTPEDSSGPTKPTYTVRFLNTADGSVVRTYRVTMGAVLDAAKVPAAPAYAGHTFVGWYLDSAGTEPFVPAAQVITANLDVYTKWETAAPETFAVTVSTAAHGAVTADKTSAAAGETVTLTAAPETGYALSALTVTHSGGTVTAQQSKTKENEYSFTMPAAPVTVTAAFAEESAETPEYTVASGGYVAATIEALSGTGAVALAVCDANETELAAKSGMAVDGALEFTLPANGKFTVTVTGGMPESNGALSVAAKVWYAPAGSYDETEAACTAAVTGASCLVTLPDIPAGNEIHSLIAYVTVTGDAPTYAVSVVTGEHGTVTPDKTSAAAGETVTLTLTPESDSYHATDVQVLEGEDSKIVSTICVNDTTYTFVMPADTVSVSATFALRTYSVTLHPGEGTINAGDVTSYTYGVGATLPTDVTRGGYRFDGWFDAAVGGDSYGVIGTAASGDKEYWAHWTRLYSVSMGSMEHGTVKADPSSAAAGETVTLIVSPEEGYRLAAESLSYQAGSSDPQTVYEVDSVYSFTMPASDVTVSAAFAPDDLEITVTQGLTGGSAVSIKIGSDAPAITLPTSDPITAQLGQEVEVQFSHMETYQLAEVTVSSMDGKRSFTVGPVDMDLCRFTMPAYPVTVTARFLQPTGLYYTYDSGTQTLTFYGSSGEGRTELTPDPEETPSPLAPASVPYRDGTEVKVQKVVFAETVRPTRTDNWFNGWSALSSVEGLDKLDTALVGCMTGMFSGCAGLTTLDLSAWSTCNVENADRMFNGCTNLTTIYASDRFDATRLATDENVDMFAGCVALIGGEGTEYSASNTDSSYAVIDLGEERPGYFTVPD